MSQAPISMKYDRTSDLGERLKLLDEDWGTYGGWHPYGTYGHPPDESDLKYVKPDFLIEGVDHHLFYLPVVFKTEAAADAAAKYIQKHLGDKMLTLEYQEKDESPSTAEIALRTLYMTFEDPKILIQLHKICAAAGLNHTFDNVYYNQIRLGKMHDRLQSKNKDIQLLRKEMNNLAIM